MAAIADAQINQATTYNETSNSSTQRSKKQKKEHEHWMTDLGFCILGIQNNFSYIIGISAAIDLVSSSFPKAVVMFCDIAPGAIISSILPQFHQLINFRLVCFIISLVGIFGYIIAGLSKKIGYGFGLLGVICFSIQVGIESPSLSHSGKFLPDASGWFCTGMAIAGVLGSFLYAFLTETCKISYDIVLFCFSPIPLIANLGCWLTYQKPSRKLFLEQIQVQAQTEAGTGLSSRQSSLQVSEITGDLSNDQETKEMVKKCYADEKTTELSSWKDKRDSLKHNWVALVSLLTVYIFQYSNSSGVNPTLKIKTSAAAFYKWAAFAQRVGNLIGRCSILVWATPFWSLMIYSFVALAILILFTCESALRFINNGIVLICIMPIMGICSGVLYSDSMYWIQKRNEHENPRAYALGMAGTMTDYGVIIASGIGAGLEIGLKALHPEDWK